MGNKKFGAKLKELRKRNGLTQKDVYEQLGISQSTFSSWEIGKSEPDAMTFLKLCKLYHVSDILLEFTGSSLQKTFNSDMQLFNQLDIEDKAEIRGEMKQMLKADKYKKNVISANDEDTPIMRLPLVGRDGTNIVHTLTGEEARKAQKFIEENYPELK